MIRRFASFCCVIAALATAAHADENAEREVLKNFTNRQKELASRVVSTDDLDERRTLMQEQEKLLTETLAKLTEPNRSTFAVVVRIVQPIQQNGSAYIERVGAISAAGTFDFTTIKSKEEFSERRAKLDELLAANDALARRLNRVDEDVARELDQSSLTVRQKREFTEGFKRGMGRTIGPSRAIRTIDTMVWTKLKESLTLLEEHWGAWSANEGEIVWTKDEPRDAYIRLSDEIAELVERQAAAEQELARRM